MPVIVKNVESGARFQVPGLNHVVLLVDRSETLLTELALNSLPAGVAGAAHFHNTREQLFFIIEDCGPASVTIAGQVFDVAVNDLLYVPIGATHRAVPASDRPLTYLLFNAFTDTDKEGHATFADRVAVSQHERRQQADQAAEGIPIVWQQGLHAPWRARIANEAAGPGIVSLLAPPATFRTAVDLVRQQAEAGIDLSLRPGAELSALVLSGSGWLSAGDDRWPLAPNTAVFVPAGEAARLTAGPDGVTVLCLSTLLQHQMDPAGHDTVRALKGGVGEV